MAAVPPIGPFPAAMANMAAFGNHNCVGVMNMQFDYTASDANINELLAQVINPTNRSQNPANVHENFMQWHEEVDDGVRVAMLQALAQANNNEWRRLEGIQMGTKDNVDHHHWNHLVQVNYTSANMRLIARACWPGTHPFNKRMNLAEMHYTMIICLHKVKETIVEWNRIYDALPNPIKKARDMPKAMRTIIDNMTKYIPIYSVVLGADTIFGWLLP